MRIGNQWTMKSVELHRTAAPIYALCCDDADVLVGCGDGHLLAWSPADPGSIRLAATAPSSIFSLAMLADGRIGMGTSAGELILVDRAAGKAVQRVQSHTSAIHAVLKLGPERLATAGADGILRIWAKGPAGYAPLRSITLCDSKLRGLALSLNGELMAVACGDGPVRVLDTVLFNEALTFTGHVGGTLSVAFHPSKPAILSGGKDGLLRAWPISGNSDTSPAIEAHRGAIYGIAFSPEGEGLATASRDKHVKLWDANALEHKARLDHRSAGHRYSVNAVAWGVHGLYSAGDDRRLLRWTNAH